MSPFLRLLDLIVVVERHLSVAAGTPMTDEGLVPVVILSTIPPPFGGGPAFSLLEGVLITLLSF